VGRRRSNERRGFGIDLLAEAASYAIGQLHRRFHFHRTLIFYDKENFRGVP
jgi:hypothetical protein